MWWKVGLAVGKRFLPHLLVLAAGMLSGGWLANDADRIAELRTQLALYSMELQHANQELEKAKLQVRLADEAYQKIQETKERWKQEALTRKRKWEKHRDSKPEVKDWASSPYRGVD